jgi:folate-dependent phosphoribosylglycinamide formyltransferase PurN
MQRTQVSSPISRVRKHAKDFGVRSVLRRSLGLGSLEPKSVPWHGPTGVSGLSVPAYCAKHGIPLVTLDTFDAPPDVARLRALEADVFVYAGAGIIRAPTLTVPRLGTLNAHMGLLPPMRGMNVTEWSAVYGAPIGCTVHLIDPGIDTGDILAFRAVDATGAASIDTLRERVDRAQIDLLGDVLRWILETGTLPPRRSQRADEGRQYFIMHDAVREVLSGALRKSAGIVRAGADR